LSHLKEYRTKNLVSRINRIEGQVKGINKMIVEEKPYDEIMIQINSTRSVVELAMLEPILSLSIINKNNNPCIENSLISYLTATPTKPSPSSAAIGLYDKLL